MRAFPRPAALMLAGLLIAGCTDSSGSSGSPREADRGESAGTAAPVIGAWHNLVPDPGGDGVLLVNGYPESGTGTEPLELWRWDGESWSRLATDGGPSGRNFAATALDTKRDVLVLQGGQTAAGTSKETWEWDGSMWRLVSTGGPGPRAAAAMAYDAASGQVVLYGGDGGEMDLKSDTWAWNGDTWSRLAARGPTPVRFPAMMTFDEQHRRLVLYGGHQVVDERDPAAVGDTWIWADGSWRLAEPRSEPGVLVNAAGLSHPEHGLLLVGGSDLDDETGEVWQWTGSSWRTVGDDIIPGRQAFGLALDPDRGVLVMTGGVVEPGSLDRHQDVWEWDGDPAHPAARVRE